MSKASGDPLRENSVIIDALPIGILVFGDEGRIESMNGLLLEKTGGSREEFIGRFLYDMVEPQSISSVLELIKNGGGPLSVRLKCGDNSSVPGIVSIGSIKNGRVGLFIDSESTGLDKEMEGISLETLDEIPLPIDIIKKDMELYFQNSASEEMISLAAKGRDPILKPTKERRSVLLDCFSGSTGGRATVEVDPKGDAMEFDVISVPMTISGLGPSAMEIWIQSPSDNEDKKESKLLEGLGDELIESSNAIIIGLDLEGNVKLFNKGARRALGYSFEEVEGKPWFDMLVDKSAEKGKLEVLQWNIGTGFRTQYESRVRARSGMTLVISLENTVIFDDEGDVSTILMIGQDITKTKKLEESLRNQSEKLLDAIEEADLYTDLVIHDMHNANAGIMGYLELLGIQGGDAKKREDYINRALFEVNKSSNIIRDVKLMSRARPNVEPEPVDLGSCVIEAFEKVKEDNQGIDMKFDIDIKDITVLADGLLREGIQRIIENSLKHSKVGSELRVEVNAGRDPSKSNLVPDPVHIEIKDNGGGMEEKDIEKAFNRPSRTDLGSHGLGFYLIKRIISRYGGIIWLENDEKEKGLTVHMVLREGI